MTGPVHPSARHESPSRLASARRQAWALVESGRAAGDSRFDWFDWGIAGLIVLNVVAFVLETEPAVHDPLADLFHGFEVFSITVFAGEYLLRLWSCTADPRYASPIRGRLRFALRPLQVIDLLAVLPAFLLFLPDLRVVRAFRLLRLLRVLKLGRYSRAAALLGRVLRQRRGDLAVMGLVLSVVLVVSASLLHYAEEHAQPDKFGSIPQALWWAVITLTTIGYGDVYPITPLGKTLGGLIAVAGIGIVALPTAIIASGFSEELRKSHDAKEAGGRHHGAHPPAGTADSPVSGNTATTFACPHCGGAIAATARASDAST